MPPTVEGLHVDVGDVGGVTVVLSYYYLKLILTEVIDNIIIASNN